MRWFATNPHESLDQAMGRLARRVSLKRWWVAGHRNWMVIIVHASEQEEQCTST